MIHLFNRHHLAVIFVITANPFYWKICVTYMISSVVFNVLPVKGDSVLDCALAFLVIH